MNADEHKFLYKEEAYKINGCAMEVLNTLGHGLWEKPYENALVVEFELGKIPYAQQRVYPVVYKEVQVGEYIPDLIVFDKIVVDTKVVNRISDHEVGQMMNYLRITRLNLGIILNFKKSKLESKRVVCSDKD
jgi:GxxExxY protein